MDDFSKRLKNDLDKDS